jgi:hypothetical protein
MFHLSNKEYIGMRFHSLVIEEIEEVTGTKGRATAYCLCDCGNHTLARKSDVIRGHTMSCGCINKRKIKKDNHGVRWDPQNKKFEAYVGKKILGYFFQEDIAHIVVENYRSTHQKT